MSTTKNALFLQEANSATFNIALTVAAGENFASGLVDLKDSDILKDALGFSSTGWISSVVLDIETLATETVFFAAAFVSTKAKSPTAYKDFNSMSGRKKIQLTSTNPGGSITPRMIKSLSYKVKGAALEDNDVACLCVGVEFATKVATGKTVSYNIGAVVTLRGADQSGNELADVGLSTSAAARS